MKPKQITSVILALFLLSGCGSTLTTTAGNDPVVISAETATAIAVDTFDTAFKAEATLRAAGKVPDNINTYFNYARANAPQWIATARSMTAAYKDNRSSTNKANLQTAASVLDAAVLQINTYLGQIQK